MAVFELPLAELELYQGRNPRPEDFDEYWAQGLSEVENTAPEVDLRPHATPARFAECFDLWYTGVGGARIHAQYLRPRGGGPHPAILGFHGYGGSAGDWFDKLAWIAHGIAVATMDVRGQGGPSEDLGGVKGMTWQGHIVRGLDDEPSKLFFRQVYLDTVQLARCVTQLPEIDPTRLATIGGSQGGGLALACAALEPRVSRVVSLFPFLSDYRRVWELALETEPYAELRNYFRHHDPTHTREEEIFQRLGYIDVQHLADRIQAQVLMATGLMDQVTPPSTQFAAFNKIRSTKAVQMYPDFGHEHLPGFADRTFDFLADL
jgi:cephalosporin-C deacetylase